MTNPAATGPPDTQLGGAFPLKRPRAPEGRGRSQACSGPGQSGHLKPEHEAATPDHRALVKEIQGETQVHRASRGLDKTGNSNPNENTDALDFIKMQNFRQKVQFGDGVGQQGAGYTELVRMAPSEDREGHARLTGEDVLTPSSRAHVLHRQASRETEARATGDAPHAPGRPRPRRSGGGTAGVPGVSHPCAAIWGKVCPLLVDNTTPTP